MKMTMNDESKASLSEARVYESMGLHAEALAVYEKILPGVEQSDSEIIMDISSRILGLKQKLADDISKKNKESDISEEALEHLKGRDADKKDIIPILDRAAVFTEKGLHDEAANEYAMLFSLGFSSETVISPIIDTLITICPYGQMGKEITRVIDKLNMSASELIEISKRFGIEVAERGRFTSAIDLVEKLKEMGAEKKEVQETLRTIVGGYIAEPRSTYLIDHTPLTDKDLTDALLAAQKEGVSILSALISQHLIEKDKLLKAFSDYHECPAVIFDATIQPPSRLVMELDEAVLLSRRWVPLKWDESGAEVLMENPQDTYQQGQVKSFLNTSKVLFYPGIQEDIELFIEHFFKTGLELRQKIIQKEASETDANIVMDIVEMLEQKNGHRQKRDVVYR